MAFSVQYFLIFKKFELYYVVAPSIVALVLGTFLGYFSLIRNKLKQSNEQFRAVVDIAEEFIYYRELDGKYLYLSPSCEELTGYSTNDFYKKPNFFDELIYEDDKPIWNGHVHNINDEMKAETFDIRIITQQGNIKWIKHICAAVLDENGKKIGVRSSNIDITKQKENDKKIFNMAFYDPLTSLPNRQLFEKSLTSIIENIKNNNDIFALMFLDLDRFKNINDSFGHKLGDAVLVDVSNKLSKYINSECLISRFGGDEFIFICQDLKTTDKTSEFANEIISLLEQPIIIDGIDMYISGSFGVAFYPEDGIDITTLIRNADTAMYKSKKDNISKVIFYQTEFGNEATHFVSTEQNLHRGIDKKEFIPFYQPKVDMTTGKIIGAEALARWMNAEQGMIMPEKFIDIAEETSKIIEIGKQITEKVLQDMMQWKKEGIEIPVSINVSARQFSNRDYFNDLQVLVKKHDIKPEMIEIEITEQVFLGDLVIASKRLNEFRSAGFKIALDDFGTGYSSMSYLHQLPIDILKIDKEFIDGLASNKKSLSIMKAIVAISQDLNYTTIAEGVEKEEQKDILLGLNCNVAQGFLFHKPMPEDEFTTLLNK